MNYYISIKGARQHNLKNVNLNIPKNKLVVFTGVSGSGKSSLAFDTIYAEGQRRYVESLSSYARQFLGIMDKPDVDSIEGLSPAISIDQKTTSRNPRSTVGTVTEIYDYLRLLFAKIGHPHCPVCNREISQQTLDQIIDSALNLINKTSKEKKKGWFFIFAPLIKDKKGEFHELFENLKSKGFTRVRIDGRLYNLSNNIVLIKTNRHTIDVLIDRINFSEAEIKSRLADSFNQALNLSQGYAILSEILDTEFSLPEFPKKFNDHLFSEKFACPIDNISIPEIEPRTFSFNSPHGACIVCAGLGKILKVDADLVFSPELSVLEGGIRPFAGMIESNSWFGNLIQRELKSAGIDLTKPISQLSADEKQIILYGRNKFEGVANNLERRFKETKSEWSREEIAKYMREIVCGFCKGARLKKESLSITIAGFNIAEITSFSIVEIIKWLENLNSDLSQREIEIGKLIIKELAARLQFLNDVGLDYLTLDRSAGSLSGGEAQRIRLASQIGSGLTGVLYILDEPTIGLHPRDNKRLINTLKRLRNLGNSVIVVEHDSEMIKNADWVVDFGPGAGKNGGEIVAQGNPQQIIKNSDSITGKYLSGKRKIEPFHGSNNLVCQSLELIGASEHNLKNINVEFPLSKLVAITGVSGSGKSTLLVETLYPAIQKELNPYFRGDIGKYKELLGLENIDKVILIDQSPIGRTPRSNPSTYTKVFDLIRDLFAQTREAKALGFKKGQFSFNVKGGRCETCQGQGQIKIEMQFMSDIWITCEVCQAKRYNSQTLEVTYKSKNIAEVLNLTVNEAVEFFNNHPQIISKLEILSLVGLDYMELGQPAITLSGGEAQRVKLASELAKKTSGRTVYILDEPTTGLHFADVEKLLRVLKLLVHKGNSVFVIEHNLDVIKNSDWIIDLGPEGGDKGGKVVAVGTPRDIKQDKNSVTGKYL